MIVSVIVTDPATLIPAGDTQTWSPAANFSIVDITVTEDTTVSLDPGQDGQKLGLRFWSNVADHSWTVTFGDGLHVGSIAGTAFGTSGGRDCDYLELMYSARDAAWWGMVWTPGINHVFD